MTTTKLTDLKERLKARGVDVDRLVVVGIHGEQFIGETEGLPDRYDDHLVGPVAITLTNPKRLIRLQQVGPHGMQINFMIGDLDFMEKGFMEVRPLAGYFLTWMSEESQLALLGLYHDFLSMKAADKAGLALPDGAGIIRGK